MTDAIFAQKLFQLRILTGNFILKSVDRSCTSRGSNMGCPFAVRVLITPPDMLRRMPDHRQPAKDCIKHHILHT